MLTWMWMGTTLWSMGSHSILGALWDKVGLVGQAKGIRKVASTSGTLPYHHGRVSVSVLARIQLSQLTTN